MWGATVTCQRISRRMRNWRVRYIFFPRCNRIWFFMTVVNTVNTEITISALRNQTNQSEFEVTHPPSGNENRGKSHVNYITLSFGLSPDWPKILFPDDVVIPCQWNAPGKKTVHIKCWERKTWHFAVEFEYSTKERSTYLAGGFSGDVLSCSLGVWGGVRRAFSTSEWSWDEIGADASSSLTGAGTAVFEEPPVGTWMAGCLSPDENFWPFI